MRHKICVRVVSFVALILLCVSLNPALTKTEKGTSLVPEKVMKQVVRQILTSKFEGTRTDKTVYLLDRGIKSSWLPAIKNIHFQTVSNEVRPDEVYFFTEPEMRGKTSVEIGFGYGNPDCSATGDTWIFNISGDDLGLRQDGGFGMGCGRGFGVGEGYASSQ